MGQGGVWVTGAWRRFEVVEYAIAEARAMVDSYFATPRIARAATSAGRVHG
jgi:hypothetical protein